MIFSKRFLTTPGFFLSFVENKGFMARLCASYTGKIAGTGELRRTVAKEESGVRPVRTRLSSGIKEFGGVSRKDLRGERTLVTKIPEMGNRNFNHGFTRR